MVELLTSTLNPRPLPLYPPNQVSLLFLLSSSTKTNPHTTPTSSPSNPHHLTPPPISPPSSSSESSSTAPHPTVGFASGPETQIRSTTLFRRKTWSPAPEAPSSRWWFPAISSSVPTKTIRSESGKSTTTTTTKIYPTTATNA